MKTEGLHIYELHVKGFTEECPLIEENKRGKFLGICEDRIIDHLLALDVNAVQLMPVFNCVDSYWGYSSSSWTELNPKYGTLDEFTTMVRKLQANGIKVILDVVYNHTHGEFEGVSYYDWDVSGCGNTVDVKASLLVIMESINHWLRDIGVDGMRFDLANILGREGGNFKPNAQFFKKMEQYQDKILIAEPWDCAEYSLGRFPWHWKELNGGFRDYTRRGGSFYKYGVISEERSINFITCHDGFTLWDLCSYSAKRNLANGEDNRDGCNQNYSYNFGVEGETDDPVVLNARDVHCSWLIEKLRYSQNWMIYQGDEFKNSQCGNNNAYCQDNETGWVNWPN